MAQPCSAWTRRALVPFDADAALHHPSFEEAPDDLQEALAADPPCQARHQDVVVDPAEELFEVDVHDDAASAGNILLGLGQRLVGASPRAEAKTRRRECRIEDRLQDWQDRLLHEAVHHHVEDMPPPCRRHASGMSKTCLRHGGMPSWRTPPPGLGLSTPRTVLGWQVPRISDAISPSRLTAIQAFRSSTVMPSTPALPLFAFTRL